MRWNTPQLAEAVGAAKERLHAAGVPSFEYDAAFLAASLLGVSSHLALRFVVPEDIPRSFTQDYERVLARREAREPLQHIIGTAPFGIHDLTVGPGVFIPRPETEVLAEWAVGAFAEVLMSSPEECVDDPEFQTVVVDLGTGSGALAIYIAERAHPDVVIGVEKSPVAVAAAQFNAGQLSAGATTIEIVAGDMTDPGLLERYSGQVSLIVANPPYVPYVPQEAELLPPEIYHDPEDAVFSGADGMDAIRGLIPVAARLLMPGGQLGIEHDDSTAVATRDLVSQHGAFENIRALTDLAGRERFVTASKLRV